MTREEIQAFIPYKGVFGPGCNFGAASYAVPTMDWLTMKCWPAFRARYWAENLDKWIVRWECRDFARAFACFAQECWATTVGGTTDDGLAVGEIWYSPDPSQPLKGHAICPCITENGLQFIDPQNGKPCELTYDQLSSFFFLRW